MDIQWRNYRINTGIRFRRQIESSRAMEIENYKRLYLQIPNLDDQPEVHISELVNYVNRKFAENELRLISNGNSIELWVREVSMKQLDDVSDDLQAEVNGPDCDKIFQQNFATALQSAVRGIGSYGLYGDRRLFVGYNRERKVSDRKTKELRRGKHFYANDHSFEKFNNVVPTEYENRVVLGDSEEVLKRLPNNCIDLMFTSPPYNFGLEYDGTDDAIDWDGYFKKLFKVLDECIRVLKFGGRLIINVQPLFSDYIPSHHIISNYLMDKRLIWKGEILWEKNNYNCKYTAWGSWKSPSSPYLKYTWEFVEVFCKGDLKKSGHNKNADITTEQFKKYVMGKWSIAPERKMKHYSHPAMFPKELANRVLLLFSFRGDMVLDPFVGAGTTCVAAKELGRKYLGIDVSEEYVNTVEARLSEFLI